MLSELEEKFSSTLNREEFLNKIYAKGNSKDSLNMAKAALSNLDYYNKDEFNESTESILNQLKAQTEDSQLNYLRKFVSWLSLDHEHIKNKHGQAIKRKSESGVRAYMGMVKKYIRLVHGIKLNVDDVRDFVTVPKDTSERDDEPLTVQELRILCDHAGPKRKTLYMFIKDTGARIFEAVQIRKENIDFSVDPVKITLPKAITKGKKATRIQFLSSETTPRVRMLCKDLEEKDYVFGTNADPSLSKKNEINAFYRLTTLCGFTEEYETGTRKKTLHAIRAFTSSQIYNVTKDDHLAHGYIGHARYLEQYLRKTPEERGAEFKEFEPALSIYETLEVIDNSATIQDLQIELKDTKNQLYEIHGMLHKLMMDRAGEPPTK